MNKHLKILEFALSSLSRRPCKNLGITAVFSLVVFVLSSILLLTHSFRIEALRVFNSSPHVIVQRVLGGRHDLVPIEYIKGIEEIPGVGDVTPRFWGYYYDSYVDANYTVMAAGGETSSSITMLEGSFVKEGQTGVCVLGRGISERRMTERGGVFILTASDGRFYVCDVIGVFSAESALLTNDLVIVSPEDLKRLFAIPEGMATDLVVEVHNPLEVATVAKKIKNRFPDTRPITREEILATYDTIFNWRSGLMLTVFTAAVLAFCILAWDKATGLSAEEKREIGILKAIGWETSDVLELKFWEGAVVSVLSFLTGLGAGYVHVFFLGAPLFLPALKGWSTLFPDLRLLPYIDLYQILILASLTVLPYIASTMVPSWKAAITDPDAVMRG